MKVLSNLLLPTAALCFAACTAHSGDTTVHLRGQLIDMGTQQVAMHYDGAAAMIGNSRDIVLTTDAEGRFDTIITLTEPTYFNLNRNTLYLTPGDDLTMTIEQDNRESQFSGRGAEVNNYMKYRLFPKGGSFLEGGDNLRADYAATRALIDSLAATRRAWLDTLTGATDAFRRLEGARITADVANSYLSYASYSNLFAGVRSRDEYRAKSDSFYHALTPDVAPCYRQLTSDDLLDVAVVRDVMSYVVGTDEQPFASWIEGVELSPRTRELYAAAGEINKLRSRVDSTTLAQVTAFTDTLRNADFAAELRIKIDQASKLLKGQPAIDFAFTDLEGNPHRLSDFKGKAIYLDFWATWCGPCIQESPHFERLAGEFKDRDIVFLSVSTDANPAAWKGYLSQHKKELTQYNTADEAIREGWAIMYIPRFILIDSDFNIVDAYAPRPSDPATKAVIESMLD